jgi:hypothetical protein
MANWRMFVIAVVATAGAVPAAMQTEAEADRAARVDLARRLHAYVALREAAADPVLPMVSLRDPAEIRQRREALAAAIRSARQGVRQGDVLTPEIAQFLRRAIHRGCEGEVAEQLALVREELTQALPEPTIHGRWPEGVPLPTMLPGVLAALPPLPAMLQYRFMNRALVLLDIDANLIIDFISDAIPVTTETNDAH